MWKSTIIFIGTGRLTVEDWFCLILSINYKVGLKGEHGAIIHSVLFCSMIRRLTFCINHFLVWSTCMLSFFHWKDQQTKQWCCIMIITKKSKIDVCKYLSVFFYLLFRRGLLPAGWQETFRSAASRLAQTQKSPASRLAADLKVSCQPATITYQIKYFIGIYVQLCLKSSNPTLIFKSFLFLTWICCVKTNTSNNCFKAFIQ